MFGSLVGSLVRLLAGSLVGWFVPSCVRWFVVSLVGWFVRSFVHSLGIGGTSRVPFTHSVFTFKADSFADGA
jgi:hypothetical protein